MISLDGYKKQGIIGTIIVHLIVVALLFIFGFTPPAVEYPEPDGIMVNFGDLVVGDNTEISSAENTSVQDVTPSQSSESEVVTQTETSIPIESHKVDNKVEQSKATSEELEKQQQQEEFQKKMDALGKKLNQGNGNGSNNGGNSATGSESGTSGNSNGTSQGKNKGTPGNPYGNGDAAYLAKPANTTNCDNPIVITVKVNPSGNVIAVQKIETALAEQTCIDAAIEAAKKTTFKPDEREVRYAKITYEYTISHK